MTFSCDFSVLRISGMMLEGLNSEHVILYMHVLLVGHGQPAGTRYPCGHGYGQKPVPGCGYGFLSEQVSFSRARVWERDTQRVHARCHLYAQCTSIYFTVHVYITFFAKNNFFSWGVGLGWRGP